MTTLSFNIKDDGLRVKYKNSKEGVTVLNQVEIWAREPYMLRKVSILILEVSKPRAVRRRALAIVIQAYF